MESSDMANFKPATIRSHTPVSIADALGQLLLSGPLADHLVRQEVFNAWDRCSGASLQTLNRYLKGDILYVTLSSSLVRKELHMNLDNIIDAMNRELEGNDIFRMTHRNITIGKIILH